MGKDGSNIANGVISAFVLISGITFSALVASMFKKLGAITASIINDGTGADISSNIINTSLPVWSLGFAYMVPGLLGVISAIIRKKGMYIAHMVFCILTLLVMAIFFLIGIFALSALAVYSPDTCLTSGNVCTCAGITTMNFTCEELTSMYAMSVSVLVIIVIAWVLVLTNTILAGILTCRQEPSSASVVQLSTVPGLGHQVTFTPQVHDSAKLVHNLEY